MFGPPWLNAEKQGLATLILNSHDHAFGRALIPSARQEQSERLRCQELFACGFPVLAHGSEDDPKLTYANADALLLWETTWTGLIGLPSKLTAPESERVERQEALGKAEDFKAISGYGGIRISRRGRRFMIRNARIWSVRDNSEKVLGQAASFRDWWWI